MRFDQKDVEFMPATLEPGVLYVSREYEIAVHLCACGCGSKIRTPLGPTEWSVTVTHNGPTLSPSIGTWQLECQSHYWISDGSVRWAEKWTEEQVLLGREDEKRRLHEYLEAKNPHKSGTVERVWNWLQSLFSRKKL